MKRGIAYGIGTYFILAAIWMPTDPGLRYRLMQLDEATVAFLLGSVVIAVIAFYAATFLPPRRSWEHAWLGGVLGFFSTIGGMLLLVTILAGSVELLRRPAAATPPPCTSGTDCR